VIDGRVSIDGNVRIKTVKTDGALEWNVLDAILPPALLRTWHQPEAPHGGCMLHHTVVRIDLFLYL
jgi:hypothetical protein